jgi:hypothetical protein
MAEIHQAPVGNSTKRGQYKPAGMPALRVMVRCTNPGTVGDLPDFPGLRDALAGVSHTWGEGA